MDMQATTPVDPRVLDKMLPHYTQQFGNPHSRTHFYGWENEDAVEDARNVRDIFTICTRLKLTVAAKVDVFEFHIPSSFSELYLTLRVFLFTISKHSFFVVRLLLDIPSFWERTPSLPSSSSLPPSCIVQ